MWWMADDDTTQTPEGSTTQQYNVSGNGESDSDMKNATNQSSINLPREFIGPVVVINMIVSCFSMFSFLCKVQ